MVFVATVNVSDTCCDMEMFAWLARHHALFCFQERMELKEAQRKAALPKSKLQLRRIAENKETRKHGN